MNVIVNVILRNGFYLMSKESFLMHEEKKIDTVQAFLDRFSLRKIETKNFYIIEFEEPNKIDKSYIKARLK